MSDHHDDADRISRGLRDLLAEAAPAQHALAAHLGIGATDAHALQHLAGAPHPAGTVELGNVLGIRSASAAALVDRLEATGHLRRQPHPTDGRRVTLHVTDSAERQVREALIPLLRGIFTLVEHMTNEEAATVATFLENAVRLLREYTAGDHWTSEA
ncbi:MarR family winged helix-turn-helix transcriptional regulator [Amycolatopsis sp. NPDC004378]